MFHQESDLIPALRVTNKTFVVPEAIIAFEHRKGWVLIVMPWAMRYLLRVFAKP